MLGVIVGLPKNVPADKIETTSEIWPAVTTGSPFASVFVAMVLIHASMATTPEIEAVSYPKS
jgi:hypothetical protein